MNNNHDNNSTINKISCFKLEYIRKNQKDHQSLIPLDFDSLLN